MKTNAFFGSLTVVSAALLLAFGLGEVRASNIDQGTLDPSAVSVAITASCASYSAGKPVRLRIALKNISNKDATIWFFGPTTDVRLVIRDPKGDVVAPVRMVDPVWFAATGHPNVLKPGEVAVEPDATLVNWGYVLKSAGTYRITAYRRLGTSNALEVASNTVTVEVH